MRDHSHDPMRHDGRFVRASDHPELVTGDLFVPPQPASLAHGTSGPSSRSILAFSAIAMAGLLAWTGMQGGADDEIPTAARTLPAECQSWRNDARRALAEFAMHADDTQLAEVGDAVFRLRRAGRNCGAGWLTLACQDYRAVTRSVASKAALTLDIPQCGGVAAWEQVQGTRPQRNAP